MKRILKLLQTLLVLFFPVAVFAAAGPALPAGGNIALVDIINRIIAIAWPVLGVVATLAFVWVGFLMLVAHGDATKLANARKIFYMIFVGVIVAVLAFSMVQIVNNIINGPLPTSIPIKTLPPLTPSPPVFGDGGSGSIGVVVNGTSYNTIGGALTYHRFVSTPGATPTPNVNDPVITGPVQVSAIPSCTNTTCIPFADFAVSQDFAQNARVALVTEINIVQFYLKKTGTPPDATVRIVSDNSGFPGLNVIATGILPAHNVANGFGWVSAQFPSSFILDSSQNYWVVIDSPVHEAANYYTIAATDRRTSNGGARVGRYAEIWSYTNPPTLDGVLRFLLIP